MGEDSMIDLLAFQSLTWVERLSDQAALGVGLDELLFQSLTWVERLSDFRRRWRREENNCFNPSPGLNVFQTLLTT